MDKYNCRIVTAEGIVKNTVIEAESQFQIYDIIEKTHATPLSVKKAAAEINISFLPKFKKEIKPQQLENLTAQLVVMLGAGVPLIDCLESLAEQAETPRLLAVIKDIIAKVKGGIAFSAALEQHPEIFNQLYCNMVKIGEATGVLEQILMHLRVFIRHDIQVVKNIKSALRYPIIVLTILVFAFTGAIIFIIPKFEKCSPPQGLNCHCLPRFSLV